MSRAALRSHSDTEIVNLIAKDETKRDVESLISITDDNAN